MDQAKELPGCIVRCLYGITSPIWGPFLCNVTLMSVKGDFCWFDQSYLLLSLSVLEREYKEEGGSVHWF